MDRYESYRAKSRIMSYYFPEPHELALAKKIEPFERAKKEWLKHAQEAIAEVERMTFENFESQRDFHRARLPDECRECGQVAPKLPSQSTGDSAAEQKEPGNGN